VLAQVDGIIYDLMARTVGALQREILSGTGAPAAPTAPPRRSTCASKKVNRVGNGFRNSTNYLLLHCGVRWQTHQTARLRGRSPRLVA
jgi:hypothetical protein